jgi:hypothetical protein
VTDELVTADDKDAEATNIADRDPDAKGVLLAELLFSCKARSLHI